ncbi:E3 UFM1-protein ligase 1 homolog [Polistes fuscatus]|uniref:E3 UFM1-protein ligase 1 homolog n=1 Tax=Polistes fuscatus TaxID=30207 RepID=UPI001CA8AA7B|nr:E3 UFM1-protein ligase 1 homolog [Polistes fuscatus]XP_043488272.1 E3 UFM1-protein ligase 1 homolog [Polistes fuscatus]
MDWEEIEKLAADFQSAQLSSNLQKLTENNCIEIVSKLIETKRLDVVFTNDRKEYVTRQYLKTQIIDELSFHGGRMNLNDIAQILNVSLTLITTLANEIQATESGIHVVLGYLINEEYWEQMMKDINDKLWQHHYIKVVDLTLFYNLPTEFIRTTIETALTRKIIMDVEITQDKQIYYTNRFIKTNKAKIRGALSAITKPVSLSVISKECSVPDFVIYPVLGELQQKKQISGIISGDQVKTGMFLPHIYVKNQTQWIHDFYKQNGYLEYDALVRLGISDPKHTIKKYFPNDDIIFLASVAVNDIIVDQIKTIANDIINTKSFIDVRDYLPSILNEKDIEIFLNKILDNSPVKVFMETVLVSDDFLYNSLQLLYKVAEHKAQMIVTSGKWLQLVCEDKIKFKSDDNIVKNNKTHKKEERRKKATSGKAGGGNQGRETKTKSTKKKYLQQKVNEDLSDDENIYIKDKNVDHELVSLEDITAELIKNREIAAIDDLADQLALTLHQKVNEYALCAAEKLAESSDAFNTDELKKDLIILATNIKIFNESIKLFEQESQRTSLTEYLMKSLCRDFVTRLFKLASLQNKLQYPDNIDFNTIKKILVELPSDIQVPLNNIYIAVTKCIIKDFLNFTTPALQACSVIQKKHNKDINKQIIFTHKEALLKELKITQDPALALNLVTSLIFTAATQNIIHMSGKHVSMVLSFLQSYVIPETSELLNNYCDLVKSSISSSENSEKIEAQEALKNQLELIKMIPDNINTHIKTQKSEG